MTAVVQEPPEGEFRVIDRSLTLARVADELAGGQQICVHGCSRSDLWQLELVSEPYGYDLVFVATPNLATGGVYFTRKHQGTLDDTRTALLRKGHRKRFLATGAKPGECATTERLVGKRRGESDELGIWNQRSSCLTSPGIHSR
jgi:hypothetical protein